MIQIIHVPWYLTLAFAAGCAYFLTNNLETVIPWFTGLAELGFMVYLESFVFVIGLLLLARDDDSRAITVMEVLPTLGFLGTAVGFTQFLGTWDATGSNLDIGGMKLAFMTTAQALFYNALLMLVYMGRRRLQVRQRSRVSDEDEWWRKDGRWGP